MRVLAHIHTFNDADIIDGTIEALLRQTRSVDGILVVDNASSDRTLDQPSVKHATVLRHPENRGTSGAVISGLRYALEHDYDWIWVFDADSVPEPDALEKLLGLYAGWSQDQQDETAFLACLYHNLGNALPKHGGIFTPYGIDEVKPEPGARYYPCHFVIWSGCLYRLAAVRQIGLPNPDYVLDWGEIEYGQRVMRAGYKGYIDQNAILQHNIRGYLTLTEIEITRGAEIFKILEFPPIRCYYGCRNPLYFLLYEIKETHGKLLMKMVWNVMMLPLNLMRRPRNHGKQIVACCRGLWHGVTGNIAARY